MIKKFAQALLGKKCSHIVSVQLHRWRTERAYRQWIQTEYGIEGHRRLEALRNFHQGERAFVIGNGPSLMKMDLDKLHKEVTIGCNAIFVAFSQLGWTTTYYTVEDTLAAEDRGKLIAAIEGPTKLIPLDLKTWIPDHQALWINFIRWYPGFPKFSHNFSRRVYWGGTVTYLNLQLAVYLGCNPIYLIGVDHYYRTDHNMIKQSGLWTSLEADPNHLLPGLIEKGYRWHDPNLARMERAYMRAKDETDRLGIQIINATAGGKLEVFPRQAFDSLF